MQHRVGAARNPFGPQFTRGWMEQREEFSGTSAYILMTLPLGLTFGLPACTRLWDGLVGSGFIVLDRAAPSGPVRLDPHRESPAFPLEIRLLDYLFFASASGSVTCTIPA